MEDRLVASELRRRGPESGGSAEPERAGLAPLAALGAIAVVTAAWWAFALAPLPAAAPDWVARARATCFGAEGEGLPHAAGWLALVIQPALMLGLELTIWRAETRAALARMARGRRGRAGLALAILALVAGLGLAGRRVAGAAGALPDETAAAAPVADDRAGAPRVPLRGERIDRSAPALRLVDQQGRPFDLAELSGRTVFVTFAFAHCATACPRIVSDAVAARATLPDPAPVIVVVTLDPWRDTPARLPALAARWRLADGDRALSGTVAEVTRALDDWEVRRYRDPRNGDVIHSPVTYVVDPAGRIAWRTDGSAASLIALAGTP
jgi:protein SCO1/2